MTIAVICYGPHSDLAARFLESIYRRTDPRAFELRIGLNEVAPATLAIVDGYIALYGNITVFNEARNLFKNPLMRRMFREKALTTDWVIWFDDDSYVTRGDWLQRLALNIERDPTVAQWGKQYVLRRRDPISEKFIKAASWYRGVPIMRSTGTDDQDAMEFHFATGGFWAMRTSVIQELDWPDPRLVHANEDFILGEALRQNGFRRGSFHYGIDVNAAPRRNENAIEVGELGAVSRPR